MDLSYFFRTVSPADASGGLCTTADDMVKWLQFHLAKGQLSNGRHRMRQRLFDDMHSSQVHLSPENLPVVQPYFPVTDLPTSYGLGWTLGSYRGKMPTLVCTVYFIIESLHLTFIYIYLLHSIS